MGIPKRFWSVEFQEVLKGLPFKEREKLLKFLEGFKESSGLIIYGKPQSGKTTLLCALLKEIYRRHKVKGYYTSFSRVFLYLRRGGDLKQLYSFLVGRRLLAFDDLGDEVLGNWEKNFMGQVLEERFNNFKVTLVGTRYSLRLNELSTEDTLRDRLGDTLYLRILKLGRVVNVSP